MKKLLSFLLAMILCLGISAPAMAVSAPDLDTVSQEAANIWISLRSANLISANEEGILSVANENPYVGTLEYNRFLEAVALYNKLISDKVISVDLSTGELTHCLSTQVPEQIMVQGEHHIQTAMRQHVPLVTQVGILAAHSCTYTNLDLIGMCEDNYIELGNVYLLNKIIEAANPSHTPTAWLSTAIYWVNKVREKGDWDYKTQPDFKPWSKTFCSYYDGMYHHVTSEYIGNFNYGYTGSLLFSLDILHFGSSAVSGFDPADEEDWPAIDAGFEKATS